MKRFGDMEIGQAKGLSSHSSMQEGLSSMLYKSNELDLSPIVKQSQSSCEISDQNIYPEFLPRCKFCGNPERGNSKLIKVCACNKCWSHEICIQNHMKIESACRACRMEWIIRFHRESDMQKSASILEGYEGISEEQKISQLSSYSYRSFRDRECKNRFKNETTKAVCRYCGGNSERPDDKLIFPCQCHALDLKESWAHRKCIFEYLVNTQKDTCDKCKTKFAFGYDKVRVWICRDRKKLNLFVGKVMSLSVALLSLIGIVVFLIDHDGIEYSYLERAWSWVLVALLLGCIAILFLVLMCVILETFYIKEYRNIQVLCQKHEIAKMRTRSDIVFHKYLQDLEERNLLPAPVTDTPRKYYCKRKVEFIESIIEEEKDELADVQDRLVEIQSDTAGENIESEILKEHSSYKQSDVVLQILESSDDFRADLQEMTVSNKHSVYKCLALKE